MGTVFGFRVYGLELASDVSRCVSFQTPLPFADKALSLSSIASTRKTSTGKSFIYPSTHILVFSVLLVLTLEP